MRFVRLTPAEYADFMDDSPRQFIPQLPAYGLARTKEGHEIVYFGVIDEARNDRGRILGVGLMMIQRWKVLFQRGIINYGPTLDWENPELISFFFTELRAYLRRYYPRVIAVTCSLLVHKNRYHDTTLEGPDPVGEAVAGQLEELGLVHINKEFYQQADIQIRYIYTKDIAGLSFDEATATLSKSLRRRFHNEGRYGVEVRFLPPSQFAVFESLHSSTASRTRMHGITETSENLYRDLMEELGPEKAFLCVAYFSPTRYLRQLEEERHAITEQLALLESRKPTKARDREIDQYTQRLPLLLEQEQAARSAGAEFGDEIPINSALSFICGTELILLLGGMDKRFACYGRDYPVEREMFKLACDRGLSVYNTFGISGDFGPFAIDAPVLAFKRMLNGNVEEFLGTYVLPVRPLLAKQCGAIS